VVNVVEDIAESIPLDGEVPNTIIADNQELAITAVAPNPSTFQGVSFEVNFDEDGSISEAGASLSASTEAPASLSIPQSLFEDLGIDPADATEFRVGFAIYSDDSLFQPRSSAEQADSELPSGIGSSVISAQVSGFEVSVEGLDTPVTLELNRKPV
jgi:hypothetical protein